MAEITKQDLLDAGTDAQALEDIVNGSAVINGTGLVATRTGGNVKTISKVIADAQSTLDDANNAASTIVNRYLYDNPTAMASPGTGTFRLNNATVASATAMAIMSTTNDTGNPSIDDYLDSWDDSTNTTKGYLFFRKKGNPAIFAIFRITGALTDNTTWKQIPIAYVAGAGSWADGDEFYLGFTRNGDASDGDVVGQASSVDSEIALFSGTGGKTIKRATGTGFVKATSGVYGTQTDISNSDINASAAIALTKLATIAANSVLANQTGSTATATANAISASKLYGRGSSGNLGEITLGTGLSFSGSTLNASSVTLGTSQASTSGTSIIFSGLSGSSLSQITIACEGVSTNGSSFLIAQGRVSGSTVTSGYSGGGAGGAGGHNKGQGFVMVSEMAASYVYHGSIILSKLNNSTNTWTSQACLGRSDGANASFGGSSKIFSGAIDGVVVGTVAGTDTFDNGNINILYQ